VTAGGVVLSASQVQPERAATGAIVRTLFGPGAVGGAAPGAGVPGGGLGRRIVDIPAQSTLAGTAGARGELWFVIEGDGRLEAGGGLNARLRADQGVFVPPGLDYSVHADGPADVRLDMVTLPAAPADQPGAAGGGAPDQPEPVRRDLADCEVETTGDRRFRVLFGPGQGCDIATQFLGEIPPGRAPDHSHPYDELVFILDGEGTAHIGGVAHAVSRGTCLHLPPGLPHCLENTGSTTMRVLGVFHPADSPASKLASH
jgi:mannose-6-phosphate isomerase-like protein (cupin superfamily)